MKEGWKIKPMGDVGTFQRGGGFLKSDFVENGFPCIHYGQIHMKLGPTTYSHLTSIPKSVAAKSKIASSGDVIIAITSEDVEGSCKSTAWMGGYDVAIGAHAAIYKHNLNPQFVSYYIQSCYFQKEKEQYTHGFKVVEIKPSDIAKIPIRFPSLPEQQRIVDILDQEFAKIDALKANAEKSLQAAKDLFQATLKKELEPKEGWKVKTIGEVCEFQNGFAFKSSTFTDTGEPIIRISDIQNDEVIDTNVVFFNPSSYREDLSRFIVYPGDILIAMSGGTTGKLGMNNTQKCFYLNQRVGVFRENKALLNHEFLFHFLHTKSEESLRISAGAAQPNLSTAQIKAFEIPVPSLQEQDRVVVRLNDLNDKCKALQENYQKTLTLCDDLKQSLLRKAFNGEL